MKLIRFGNKGNEKPGVIDNENKRRDVSNSFKDWDKEFFENDGLNKLHEALKDVSSFPIVDEAERWAAPVARPGTAHRSARVSSTYSDTGNK